jgi:hypothetical protein
MSSVKEKGEHHHAADQCVHRDPDAPGPIEDPDGNPIELFEPAR